MGAATGLPQLAAGRTCADGGDVANVELDGVPVAAGGRRLAGHQVRQRLGTLAAPAPARQKTGKSVARINEVRKNVSSGTSRRWSRYGWWGR